MSNLEAEHRLTSLYDACAHRVLAYCVRHVGRDEAEDVLAETYAVAWRRLDRVPDGPPDGALPWLISVARNVIRNRRRSAAREHELVANLRDVATLSTPGVDQQVAEREEMLLALSRLSERERDALLLTCWDGLDAEAAAAASGCSPRAFRARLTRARARLRPDPPHRSEQTLPTPVGDPR